MTSNPGTLTLGLYSRLQDDRSLCSVYPSTGKSIPSGPTIPGGCRLVRETLPVPPLTLLPPGKTHSSDLSSLNLKGDPSC